eukprot:TRINITY_DN1483_c0_g1_i1.p1 TRINITY_DN1483_c0_g1~~TRINITY_DN1483_c0_g1_i1.p1  ORF type:complete len:515 (+),score=107.22 TRINITY_DN1483_c0_g1_i1:73-1617(+)
MTKISITMWLHPSMQIPFTFKDDAKVFKIDATKSIVDLMDDAEEAFEKISAESGTPLELQINVLWNVKDHKKALNPNDIIGKHFVEGDTFGIYGDIVPAVPSKCIPEADKTPVTILTGFLGAGKTTMLNYILRVQTEKKIAIIENEFGEISIDDDLLKQGGVNKKDLAEKIVVMDNGCMCCTIRGDLAGALEQMVAEIDSGTHLDQIMIETTGMADPVPIVRTFMSTPSITDRLRLDGVLTVVDSKHLIDRLEEEPEEGKVNQAFQQVAFADKLVLNKLDLIGTDKAIEVKNRIRSINSYAKILPAVKGEVKMSEITNMLCHDMTRFAEDDITAEPPVNFAEVQGHGGHGHDAHGHDAHGEGHDANCTEGHGDAGHAGHGDAGHAGHGGAGHASGTNAAVGHGHGNASTAARFDSRVNSFSIVKEGQIIPAKLSRWMQALGTLPAERGTIYRIKAILAVKGHPYKHVFHAVMDVSDEADAGEWAEGEKKVSKIVFIGKSLDEKFLRDGFFDIFE